MNSKELAQIATQAMQEKKGWDIKILGLHDLSVLTDYFVICNGNSRVQTRAIADFVEEKLVEVGVNVARREGYNEGRWILLDFGDIIVHVFQEEERTFYNLERLWGDASSISVNEGY